MVVKSPKNQPPYRIVYEVLRQEAQGIKDAESKRIPSYKVLAKKFEVGETTVVRAINLLKSDGWAYGRQGEGTYLCQRQFDQKLGHIALLVPALDGETTHYAHGLSDFLNNLNAHLTLGIYSTHGDLSQYASLLDGILQHSPDGLILIDFPRQCDINIDRLTGTRIATVAIGRSIPNLFCDLVILDTADRCKQVAKLIVKKRYNDVAVVITCVEENEEFLPRLRKDLADVGINVPNERIIIVDSVHGYTHHPNPYIDAQQQIERLLADGFRCKTLICSHDYIAVGALRAIQRAGIKVPEEMKLISGTKCAVDLVSPLKITTIDSHRDKQAELAAGLLVRRLEGHNGPPEIHHIYGTLIEGETG